MSFLFVTIPVSLLVAGLLLALVVHGVRTGAFDDWEGPALRHLDDPDEVPELPSAGDEVARRQESAGRP